MSDTTQMRRRRRRRLKTTIAVLACSVGALAAAPTAPADPPTGIGPVDTVITSLSGGITSHKFQCDKNRQEVKDMIQGVRDTLTYAFPDITTMAARGYLPYFDAPLFGLSGRQGHWINSAYMEDGHIMDPRRPESILVDRWNRPIGVMFIEDDPSIPGPNLYVAPDGTPCNTWHYHSEITADSYWWLYQYLYRGDLEEGKMPDDRSPDLMHVWRYGDYESQWTHAAPPENQMPGNPTPEEAPCLITSARPPGPTPNCND